jgi:hypothetical protein
MQVKLYFNFSYTLFQKPRVGLLQSKSTWFKIFPNEKLRSFIPAVLSFPSLSTIYLESLTQHTDRTSSVSVRGGGRGEGGGKEILKTSIFNALSHIKVSVVGIVTRLRGGQSGFK